jgi:uroporphyrinogen III methyltransferase/synthase
MTRATGKVFLLGAGPGDPELITARALRRLGECDLVVHDATVHRALLAHAKPGAEFVSVEADASSDSQRAVAERLVREARAGRKIARLVCGDPLFFGAAEQVAQLAAACVPFELVPGVSAPLAACAYAGLALTYPGLSNDTAFFAATESAENDEKAHDWKKLATATQSLVGFAEARDLGHALARLVAHGRAASEPALLVESGSTPRQRTLVGTVGTLAQLASAAGIRGPAVVIVGEVVRLRERMRWFDTQPLFGKRVLVTRPRGQEAGFAQGLRDAGAEPLLFPTIRILPPEDVAPLARAAKDAALYDVVVFTSANGVAQFFEALAADAGDARRLGRALVAAIGPATAESLAKYGVRADIVPTEYRGEAAADAVIRALGERVRGARVLVPRATVAREILPERLAAAGAQVEVAFAYRTVGASDEDARAIREALDARAIDVIALTSSSTVEQLLALLGADAARLLAGVTLASIGPITTATAQKLGLEVAVTAAEYTTPGLLDALLAHFSRPPALT